MKPGLWCHKLICMHNLYHSKMADARFWYQVTMCNSSKTKRDITNCKSRFSTVIWDLSFGTITKICCHFPLNKIAVTTSVGHVSKILYILNKSKPGNWKYEQHWVVHIYWQCFKSFHLIFLKICAMFNVWSFYVYN